MTYQTERSAIETYFIAQWAGATAAGMDGQPFEPKANTVRLSIQSGQRLPGSTGRTANRIDHVGMVTVQIFTDGAKGSSAWRGYAETLMGIFHEVTIDNAGAVIAATADAFVRFSPPTATGIQHPYIGASSTSMPFTITNVIAPFVRYEFI